MLADTRTDISSDTVGSKKSLRTSDVYVAVDPSG
jgi:hypothetical protein